MELSKEANKLANLISDGLGPFYIASCDGRKSFSKLEELAAFEQKENLFKTRCNTALVMQAEFVAKIGEKERLLLAFTVPWI